MNSLSNKPSHFSSTFCAAPCCAEAWWHGVCRAGVESFTVGHNPYCNRMVMDAALVLPSRRPQFLCEKLIGVDAHEPLARLASISHVVRGAGAKEGGTKFHGLDGATVGEHLMHEGSVIRARRLTVSTPLRRAVPPALTKRGADEERSRSGAWLVRDADAVPAGSLLPGPLCAVACPPTLAALPVCAGLLC